MNDQLITLLWMSCGNKAIGKSPSNDNDAVLLWQWYCRCCRRCVWIDRDRDVVVFRFLNFGNVVFPKRLSHCLSISLPRLSHPPRTILQWSWKSGSKKSESQRIHPDWLEQQKVWSFVLRRLLFFRQKPCEDDDDGQSSTIHQQLCFLSMVHPRTRLLPTSLPPHLFSNGPSYIISYISKSGCTVDLEQRGVVKVGVATTMMV